MAQDIIIKGRDNPVVINFSGVDLQLFTDISVNFGADERTLLLNPSSIIVSSQTELELNFQDTLEVASNTWCITGFDAVNTNGVELSSKSLNPLRSRVIEGC